MATPHIVPGPVGQTGWVSDPLLHSPLSHSGAVYSPRSGSPPLLQPRRLWKPPHSTPSSTWLYKHSISRTSSTIWASVRLRGRTTHCPPNGKMPHLPLETLILSGSAYAPVPSREKPKDKKRSSQSRPMTARQTTNQEDNASSESSDPPQNELTVRHYVPTRLAGVSWLARATGST